MTDKTYVDNVTLTDADSFNDFNRLHYTILGDPATLAALQVTLGVRRSYLAGLTLSTAGGSATMSIAAGQATNSTNVAMLTLAAFTKTTSAWAVGTGNGGIDTGAIANSTWYKFYLIQRVDTGLVDVIFTTAALATGPALPTNYTLFRYIGSGKTDGSAQWTAFTQDGDYFRWSASVLDVNTTNPGTNAVTSTLTVPTGISVLALLNILFINTGSIGIGAYLSDLSANDEAPSATAAPLSSIILQVSAIETSQQIQVRTNTSAQIRYRIGASGASTIIRMSILGWTDYRQRNA